MKLVIVHYHLRPGGIRRIIELATPHLVREAPRPITRVVLTTGEASDRRWCDFFARQVARVPVEFTVDPAFSYLSEQHGSPARIEAQVQRALAKLLAQENSENCLVWAHNLGVGRNLILARELAVACARRDIPLVSHHHDWWFDHRWTRWPEMRRFGFHTLGAAAKVVFPRQNNVLHAAINQADAAILSRHFGERACWLPNLTAPAPPPPRNRLRLARHWLNNKLAHDGAPVWLLPCRTLRRKNLAEALLLKRWLRPEAWLVVTGAASSAEEQPYFRALEQAAHQQHWRLRLGMLAGDEARKPDMAELLAASEAVLLTSVQEGFGLPYLEAAAAQRPLLARRLPHIAPDLARFGFRFPQTYDDILIAPGLFDWPAECLRQHKLYRAWRAALPAAVRKRAAPPPMLATKHLCPVPFSRLTLTAQLEVLTQPPRESWVACAPLNPFLKTWRRRASAGRLKVTSWPRSAKGWLSGEAYARRFFAALRSNSKTHPPAFSPSKIQSDFIRSKLDVRNLYPLLWSTNP